MLSQNNTVSEIGEWWVEKRLRTSKKGANIFGKMYSHHPSPGGLKNKNTLLGQDHQNCLTIRTAVRTTPHHVQVVEVKEKAAPIALFPQRKRRKN